MGIRLQESLEEWSGIEALNITSQQGEGSQAIRGKDQMNVEQVKQIVVYKGDLGRWIEETGQNKRAILGHYHFSIYYV